MGGSLIYVIFSGGEEERVSDMSIMEFLIVILILIVAMGLLNERILKLQSDIALVMLSLFLSALVLVISSLAGEGAATDFIHRLGQVNFEEYLLDYVLCFMLFAGASKVNMGKFKQNIKTISLLALLTTVVSSAAYGLLFWLAAMLFRVPMDFWTCVLLGCIVSPTDPIAATGILNKLGLSKNVTSVIESESLFNDGTGVALFVFVKSIVSKSGDSNFLVVMLKEVLGAFVVAIVISFIMFRLFKLSKDPVRQILISVLDVALVYAVCEHFGFSGVIASVICGMYFAYKVHGIGRKRAVYDPHDMYMQFWEIIESILNAILFVMIGITVLNVSISKYAVFILVAGIICVIISRFVGVMIASLFAGRDKIPSSYSLMEFVMLMTWSALKGGLSLALAMSTKEFLLPEVYLIVLNTAYLTIFFTVIVQGLTVKNAYQAIERHKARRIKQAYGRK